MFLGKRKNGYYFVDFFDPSIKKSRRISTKTKSKIEALKFLNSFKIPSEKLVEKQNTHLSEFSIEYKNFLRLTHSKKYLSSIDIAFRKFCLYLKIDLFIKDITLMMAQDFISSTYMRTKSGAALFNRTLKAAFNRAIDWGYLESNPFVKVRLPRQVKSIPIFLNQSELNLMLSHTKNNVLKELFLSAFYTGMKLSEIVNLKWDAVDLKDKIIVVKNTY